MTLNDKKIVDTIKMLSIDMINEAKSGHPGIVLGAAPILYTLFLKHLNISINDPEWINRDRFIMSAGHGSALLYATMFMAGYNITLDDLKGFRKIDSKTPGHPEYKVTPGVEITTGPLGQGLGNAVGMAMAERKLASMFNIDKKGLFAQDINIFNHYTYVLCSDGDLMEGISYEAASLAGTLKLGRLIVLYDSNNVSLDGSTNKTFTENVLGRFSALGWHTQYVNNGEDVNKVSKAIARAKKVLDKPSIIEIKTIIGKGVVGEGTNKVHGTPLSESEIETLKQKLGYNKSSFLVSQKAMTEFKNLISERINSVYSKWAEEYKLYMKEAKDTTKELLNQLIQNKFTFDISQNMWNFTEDTNEATRVTNGKVMNIVAENLPNFIGGSADLASSTKTYINKEKNFLYPSYTGKNIWFGVREHLMGAVLNGFAVSGFYPFGSTFLNFADYLKPALRLGALMDLPVTYIFTHDSVDIGQDGPTHQPIEQLAMLRATPNLNVYRPADANEVVGVWKDILNKKKPSAIVLGRNDVKLQPGSKVDEVSKGGYIISKEEKYPRGIIIATGSEVQMANLIKNELIKKGIDIRVVSMPCVENFLTQPKEYQDELFPIGIKKIVIEPSSDSVWHRFVYNDKYLININEFGASGTREQVLKKLKIDYVSVLERVEKLLR
ncbi:MAG: transketolase [Bacilli bacterium]